jgi:hypothetical protein
MTQRQIVRPQLRLERRAKCARLDARGARGAIDLENAAHLAQIDRERGAMPRLIDARRDALDHA